MNIDKIIVISLDSATDRREQFKSVIPLDVEFMIVKRNKDPMKGNYESHQQAIRIAKQAGHKNVLIFEDDAYPLESMETIKKNINNFMENPPKDWEFLNLGYIPFKVIESDNKNIYKIKCAYDAHAYIVNLERVNPVEWSGTQWDIELFCNGHRPVNLFTNPSSMISGDYRDNVYAIYPQLFSQKTNKSSINDISLTQEYFFKFYGGYNNSVHIAKYFHTIYFGVLIIFILLSFFVLAVSVSLKKYKIAKNSVYTLIFLCLLLFIFVYYELYNKEKCQIVYR